MQELNYFPETQAEIAIKTPPHSMEAEQSVLGGIILNDTKWEDVASIIVADDFYHQQNKLIFKAIANLYNNNQGIDLVTITQELDLRQELPKIGGVEYLGYIANATPSISNISYYANIVRERSILRQLIAVSGEINKMSYFPQEKTVPEVLDIAEAKIFAIADQGAKSRQGFRSVSQMLHGEEGVIAHIEKMASSDGFLTGYSTSFDELDKKTSGIQNSDLIVIAGRPSMGKTSFAMNLIEHVALTYKKPVAVFSMEMPGEQLLTRMLSSLSRVDNTKIRNGKKLNSEDWSNITQNAELLSNAPIFIDDSGNLSPSEVRSRSRRLKREQGDIGLIMVDYIQLMRANEKTDNRTAEISSISRNLKSLARELNVPVIALSQLNRSLEKRENRRPVMSDLRESGAIEQDADLIMFLYRQFVYSREKEDETKAELIISKQRNGPTGTVNLHFFGQFTRFDNPAPEYYQQDENLPHFE